MSTTASPSPSEQPDLRRAVFDANVSFLQEEQRGVDPSVLEDLGYTNPRQMGGLPKQTKVDGEALTATPLATPQTELGPHTNLAERAEWLGSALLAFGKHNQRRVGFDIASNTRPYQARIADRYGNDLPFVQAGAERNAQGYEVIAKRGLWKASSYSSLRDSGLIDNEQIDADGARMWKQFSKKYSGTHNTAREAFKGLLRREVTMTKRIIKRQVTNQTDKAA